MNLNCLNYLLRCELEKNLLDEDLFWKLVQKFQNFYNYHPNFFIQTSSSGKRQSRSSSLPLVSTSPNPNPSILSSEDAESTNALNPSNSPNSKINKQENKIFRFLERNYTSFEEFKRKNFSLTFDLSNSFSGSSTIANSNSKAPIATGILSKTPNSLFSNPISPSGNQVPAPNTSNSGGSFLGSLSKSFTDFYSTIPNLGIFGPSSNDAISSFGSAWLHLYQKFIFSDNFHYWFQNQIKKYYFFEIMSFEFGDFLKKIDKALEMTGFEEKNKLQRPKELFSDIQKIDFFMQLKTELETELSGNGWFCFDDERNSPTSSASPSPTDSMNLFDPASNENSKSQSFDENMENDKKRMKFNYSMSLGVNSHSENNKKSREYIKKLFDIMDQIVKSFRTPSIQSSLLNTLTQTRFLIKQREIETKCMEIEIPSQ